MRRWALVVVGLYLAALLALTWPVVFAAFAGKGDNFISAGEAAKVFGVWPYWIWLGIMALGQFALLAVPVQATRRPMARRPLVLTVLASGLMIGGLVVGFLFSLIEFVEHTNVRDTGSAALNLDWTVPAALILGGLMWIAWSVMFYRLGRKSEPRDVITRQCRLLFRGSVLELLVAVPSHVIARHRGYCCAGFMTFVGIAMGVAVMLFSFGPAMYFLFADRWRRLHPETAGDNSKSGHNIIIRG
jgi:hypothetical protein